MKKELFGLLCCTLLCACQNNISVNNGVPIIDGNAKTKVAVSELFPEIKVAPLQVTENSLVGIAIKDLKKSGDRLLLLNQMGSRANMLCFDTTGRFIYTLDRIGHGPQEYTYLGDFMIDPASSNLVLVTEQGRFMTFDTADNYVSQTQAAPPFFYSRQFIRTNDSTYTVFHNGDYPKGSDLLEIDSRTFTIRESAPATDILASEGLRPLSLWKGRLLYYNMNDTIYNVANIQDRTPAYYLDFGEGQRRTEDKIRRKLTADRNEALTLMVEALIQGKYVLVTRLFENDHWIAVSGVKQNPEEKQDKKHPISFFVLYNKESGKSYNSDHISWDILNLEPLTNIDLVGCDDQGTLYAIWYGFPSDEQKRKIDRSSKIPQNIKDKLMQLNDGDNPVLFMLR